MQIENKIDKNVRNVNITNAVLFAKTSIVMLCSYSTFGKTGEGNRTIRHSQVLIS